ncbi:helix-turn-helix domain-containing protein [Saccharococcus caldoxylosilyticus]|nr:helix-turn-helix domain-containing protein [Parageobacillus caldoxylosilyticus]
MKLLIAERDENESVAIRWLVSAYSLPIHRVYTANTVEQTMRILEKETPELLYIELDMVSHDDWGKMTKYVRLFCQKVIAVTAEATFARAKQAIEWQCADLLVKPLEPAKLKQCLQKAASSFVRQERLHPLHSNDAERYSYRSLFSEEVEAADVALLLLQTEDPNKWRDIVSFLTQYPFRYPSRVLPLSNMVVCLLSDVSGDMKEVAWKLLRDWEAEHTEPLAVVMLPPDGGKTVRTQYQMARRLLETTFFIGYRQVIVPAPEYEHWKELDPFLTPEEQRQWVDMLHRFDKQAIKTWMHREFLRMPTPFPNPEMVRTRLTSILAQIRRFMKTYQLDRGETERGYMRIFHEILYNRVLYRIVQEMLLFLYRLLDRAKQAEEQARTDVIEKGIRYIEEHFRNPDLTLEKVAAAVGRSPAYYSHLLMKKRGISFRKLLTQTRIKEAKRLLAQTELSIKEIAHQTGFRTSHYFTRVFKEEMKRTPTEYRDEQRKEPQ